MLRTGGGGYSMIPLMRVPLALTTSLVLLAGGSISVAAPSFGDKQLECLGHPVTIRAHPGQEVTGTRGPDVIWGTSGPDVIRARAGVDRVCGNGGRDRIYGGRGSNPRNNGIGDHLSGGPGRDVLFGGKGPDYLRGGTGRDELHGGRSFDDFILFGGGDAVFGGRGSRTDSVSYAHADGGVTVDLKLGTARLTGSAVIEHLHGIENVSGSDFDDVLLGNSEHNNLDGGDGDDVIDEGAGYSGLFGGEGNDVIRGGDDTDEIEGGPGDDYIDGGDGVDYIEDGGGGGRDTCIRAEFHNCEVILDLH
jgi:Ca2+-binding RTX toxin-like protein